MTTTAALDELLELEPDDPLDDEPPEPALEEPPPPLLPPELPEPETCWPTVTFSDATTPLIGEVKFAWARACSASVTWFSAAVNAAWSAATCADVAPDPEASSEDSFAASEDSVALACAT